jgi:hypothetical protein
MPVFEPAPAAPEPAPAAAGPSPFRGRFGFVMGALLGVGIGAVLLFVALLTTGDDPGGDLLAKNWSSWHPTSSEPVTAAPQIASHVARRYRQENKSQLGAVSTRVFDRFPILLRPKGGNIEQLNGPGVLYTFNGLGPDGKISGGKPNESRALVQRREALELALYSFRYLDEVTMVVVLFAGEEKPAAKGKKDAQSGAAAAASPDAAADDSRELQAVFYRPGDLLPQLQVPLGMTLSAKPPAVNGFKGPEAERVDNLTRTNVFSAAFQLAPDQNIYLVLDRSDASE